VAITVVQPAGDHVTIGPVSCGKKKAARACAARDLYRGELFRRASAYAERTYDHWFILSAQHYLVHPDEVLDPYEKPIASMSVADRRHWALIVESDLRMGHGAATEGRHECPPATPQLRLGDLISEGMKQGTRRSAGPLLHAGSDYADFTVNPSMNGQILAEQGISATNQFALNFDNLAALDVPGASYPSAPVVTVQSKTVSSG
jgi:hypothetical protein